MALSWRQTLVEGNAPIDQQLVKIFVEKRISIDPQWILPALDPSTDAWILGFEFLPSEPAVYDPGSFISFKSAMPGTR